MSHVLLCVQMKVSYGHVECVLQVKSNCLSQMCLDVVILLVLFGFLFTSFDENILIHNLYWNKLIKSENELRIKTLFLKYAS